MMEEDIQRSDEDDLPQPKLGGVCNNDYLMQFDNSSSIFGALEPHRSNEMFLPQHHNLYPLAPDFNYMNDQAAVEDLVSAAILTAGKNALWQPVDVPSSLPDDCLTSLASNTYDTRDYDPTDQSVLEPSAVGVYDNNHTKTYASDLGDPYEAANPHTRYDFEDSSAPLAVGQADVLAEIQSATIIHKRKRPVEGLIDRKEALDVCVESMQDAIENMAQRFGVDFDAVMDLCLQQRAKRKSTSLHISDKANTTDPTSLSTESADSIVPSREDPAPVKGVDASSIITEPSKGPRSNPGASHATKQESGNNRVHCPRCGTGISRRTDLPRHLRTHDPGEFQCQYPKCKMAFSRKDKFCDHLRKIHGDVNSRIDTVGRRKEDPGDDPDSGSSRRGGMYQVNKPFQGRQQQTSSTRLGHSACDGSSNGGTSQSHGNHEHFFPLLSNILATEFMRNYHSAQVIRKLGQGGFGHVYEFSMATGADGNRQAFACKMIRLPDHGQRAVIERARNEIGVLQVLDHPHIVTFAGAFISDKEIMISTRPVADCNLKAFLNRQLSPLSSVAKCQLWQAVGGLASAIDYIHSHGMGGGLHGDIKPENILVIQDTGVKSWTRLLLADFGSARLPSLSSASPVNHGNQAVTPRYCAPEWFTNNNERGPASDIWSFGCILTQIVTYLHDKTMADFDTYRTRDKDSKDDWTYCESLPIVNDWLSKLSKNWMESTGHIGRSEHMDLISDMLSPNPKYRPAAKEVVARLEALRQLFPEKTNRDWNYGEQLTQPHYYSHLDAIGDAKGAFKSQTIEALSKCGDSNTR
jgi:serine/threonine protein kinase